MRAGRGLHPRRVARRRRVADRAPGPDDPRLVAGTDLEVPADLIRLSVGIETADDLVADLEPWPLGGDRVRARLDQRARGAASTSAPRSPRPRWSTWPRAASSRPPRTRPRSAPTCSTGTTPAWPRWPRRTPGPAAPQVLACSSAGGGLRIAVVGNEELVTAEAGRRVALSSGGKVVARVSRPAAARPAARTSGDAAPDVVLLTGGTDGGNARGAARRAPATSSACGWTRPGRGRRQRRGRSRGGRDPGGRRHAARAGRQRRARRSACSPRTAPGPRSARCSWPT